VQAVARDVCRHRLARRTPQSRPEPRQDAVALVNFNARTTPINDSGSESMISGDRHDCYVDVAVAVHDPDTELTAAAGWLTSRRHRLSTAART
jgi:hypothetical protein